MKRLAVLLLAVSFALPACSAENQPQTTSGSTETATTSVVADNQPVVAQAEPAAATAPEAAASAPVNVSPPAERSDIVEGRDYRVLTPAQPTSSSPDKVEVAEMFMYMCPHCFSFEPFIESYRQSKPPYVSFIRVPASFNNTARVHAKAYYVAETLGILEEVHTDLFRAYHNERKRLADDDAVIAFFVDHGVAREDAEKAMKSFAVDTKVRQADTLVRRYRIDSVPTLVINGKYVTSASMVGSERKLREVIDYLVAKEAAAM